MRYQYYYSNHIGKDIMGGACRTHVEILKAYKILFSNLNTRDHMGDRNRR